MINVAVLGYGTIGSGVVEVLDINKESIAKKAGQEIQVKYVLDLRDFPGEPIQEKIVHDIDTIIEDKEVQVVVEVMGGVEPAFTFVKKALEAGKSVATSNKALVADKGAELLEIAEQNQVNFFFEASVGGGIPIIRPINTCLTADVVEEITGILNGTTNYMLTKMSKEGMEFADVLKDAQEKGYAEKDPTADVEGHDACRKIAILTSLVCGRQVDYNDILTEGITAISATDIKYAKKMNKEIKLLASSKKAGDTYTAMVSPVMIGQEHPLFPVSDVFNAVFVHGNVLGDAMFYGSGAGKLPTASAVVADIVDIVKHKNINIKVTWEKEKLELADVKTSVKKFFVRVEGTVATKLEVVKSALGEVEVVELPELANEFAVLTEKMSEKDFFEKLESVDGVLSRIRVEA